MLVRRYRFFRFASIAALALLAAPVPDASAQQVVLSNARGLDFGRFVAGTGGSVVISPTGARSRGGAVVLVNSPTVGQAIFNVSRSTNGGAGKATIISLPANGTIRLSSGANSMAVNSFVSAPVTLLSIPNGGTTLSVGATLIVGPNQAPGNYSGSFPLTVNFQ